MSVEALSDVRAESGGAAELQVDDATMTLTEHLQASVGGDVSLETRWGARIHGQGSGTLHLSDEASLTAGGDAVLRSADSLDLHADTMRLDGSEGVRVGSSGAVVDLSRADEEDGGTARVAASSALELASGETLSVASSEVSVSAGADLGVGSGGSVRVASQSIEVLSEEAVRAQMASLFASITGSAELFSGGRLSITAEQLALSSLSDIDVASAGVLEASAQSAELGVQESLVASAGGLMDLLAKATAELTTGTLHAETQEVEVSAGRSLEVAGEEATLRAGGEASLLSEETTVLAEEVDVQTGTAYAGAKELSFTGGKRASFTGKGGKVRFSSAPAKGYEAEVTTSRAAAEDKAGFLAQLAALLDVPVSRFGPLTVCENTREHCAAPSLYCDSA